MRRASAHSHTTKAESSNAVSGSNVLSLFRSNATSTVEDRWAKLQGAYRDVQDDQHTAAVAAAKAQATAAERANDLGRLLARQDYLAGQQTII